MKVERAVVAFSPLNSQLQTLNQIGCQGWIRTSTVRFNKPSCYFDTTWQWLAESKPTGEDWRCRQESHLHRSI